MKQDIITEKLRSLEPVIGKKKANQLRQLYFMEDDFREKRELENHIDYLVATHVNTSLQREIVLPPPESHICSGEIEIGNIKYIGRELYPFSINSRDINRHTIITSATGSGKTTCAKKIIREMHRKKVPILIFDWEKSYRNLIREYSDFEVVTVGKDVNPLRLNPLVLPPGIEKEEYIKSLVSVFASCYLSGAGSDTVLMLALKKMYEEISQPCFEDFKLYLAKEVSKGKRGRQMLWADTVQRILNFITVGSVWGVLKGRKHDSIERLFQKNIILELGHIHERDRKFVTHCILNWIHIWNHDYGIHSEHLKNVIVFEEFHNFTSKGNEDNLIANMFREWRKYGTGLIAIDQTIHKIPLDIVSNTSVSINFWMKIDEDKRATSKAINLPGFDSDYISMLKTGEGIVNVGQRFTEPFLIQIHLDEKDKNNSYLTDSELKSLIQPFSGARELDRLLMDEPSESQESRVNDNSPPHISHHSCPVALDPIEKLFISDLVEHPFDGTDKRTKRLGLHPEVITSIHQEHTKNGLINPVMVDGKKLFELTDKGQEIALEAGIKIKPSKGRGGLEHTYWQHQTSQFLKKQGFQPSLEFQDIDICDPDFSLAIEIETGKSDIKKNLDKLTTSGYLHVFMIATNKESEVKIKQFQKQYHFVKMMSCRAFHKLSKKDILQRNTSLSTQNTPR